MTFDTDRGTLREFPAPGGTGRKVATMDQFKVKIDLGNDAMQTAEDVALALRDVVANLENGRTEGKIFDANGNKVGSFKLS